MDSRRDSGSRGYPGATIWPLSGLHSSVPTLFPHPPVSSSGFHVPLISRQEMFRPYLPDLSSHSLNSGGKDHSNEFRKESSPDDKKNTCNLREDKRGSHKAKSSSKDWSHKKFHATSDLDRAKAQSSEGDASYLKALYSFSTQASALQQGRKVQTTSTYMPEIGTLPSNCATLHVPALSSKSSPTHRKSSSHINSSAESRSVHQEKGHKSEKVRRSKVSSPVNVKSSESAIKKSTEHSSYLSNGAVQLKQPQGTAVTPVGSVTEVANAAVSESKTCVQNGDDRTISKGSEPTVVKHAGLGKSVDKAKSKTLKSEKTSMGGSTNHIPVGIAVARKRPDVKADVSDVTSATVDSLPHNHVSRSSHPVSAMLNSAAMSHPAASQSGLGSNLVLTGGTGLLGPGQPPMWYGLPPMYHTPPAPLDPSHIMPPSGYRVCQHPLTGQMMLLPSLESQPMWPYMGHSSHPLTTHGAIPPSIGPETSCASHDSSDQNRAAILHNPFIPSLPLSHSQSYAISAAMPFYFPPPTHLAAIHPPSMAGVDVNVLSRGTSPFDESMMPSPVKSEKSVKSSSSAKAVKKETTKDVVKKGRDIKESRKREKVECTKSEKMDPPAGSEDSPVNCNVNLEENVTIKKDVEVKCYVADDKDSLSDTNCDSEILDVTTVDEADFGKTETLPSLNSVGGLELLSSLAEQQPQVEVKQPINKLEEFVRVTEQVSKCDLLRTSNKAPHSKLEELIKVTQVLEAAASCDQAQRDSNPPISAPAKEQKSSFEDLVKVTEDRYWERVTPPIEDYPISVDINENYTKKTKRNSTEKRSSSYLFTKREEKDTDMPLSPPLIAMEEMEAIEVEFRLRLSELQRRYKEKQRELARLQRASRERHHLSDSSDKSGKRGPGRPKKKALTGKTRGRKPGKSKSTDSSPSSIPTESSSVQNELEIKGKKDKQRKSVTQSKGDGSGEKKISLKNKKLSKKDLKEVSSDKLKMAEKLKAKKKLLLSKSIQMKKKKLELHSLTKPEHGHVPREKPADTPKVESKKRPLTQVLGDKQLNSSPDSPNKKRKVGRPKKISPNDKPCTKTLVAKSSKAMSSVLQLSKTKPSVMEPISVKTEFGNKCPFIDESWHRRRSERIFLSDASPLPSPTPSHKSETNSCAPSPGKEAKKLSKQRSSSVCQSLTEKLLKVPTEVTVTELAPIKNALCSPDSVSDKAALCESEAADSDGDDLPLSTFAKPKAPELRSCIILADQLHNGLRVLVPMEGLFYEGEVREIQPPDIYGVIIDGERGGRPHIYSQEEILNQIILDVQPTSPCQLPVGARICAYWSQQFSCLYPGTVEEGSPNPDRDDKLITVEFDDGDSGTISIDQVHMLPADYPVIEYDPNPIFLIGRRRTSALSEVVDWSSATRERRPSTASTVSANMSPKSPLEMPPEKKIKRGPGRPPKKPRLESLDAISENEVFYDGEEETNNIDKTELAKWELQARKILERQEGKPRDIKPKPAKFVYDDTSKTHNQDVSPSKENKWTFVDSNHVNCDIEKKSRKPSFKRSLSGNKREAVLPPPQLWSWLGSCTKRPGLKGKAKKEFYKAITRGREVIRVGDSAIFLTTGRPHLPYIGHIISMWEGWAGNMVVKVRWFYHPEETKGAARKLAGIKGALYQSSHEDENDVQTISHRCEVLPYDDYTSRVQHGSANNNTYYLAGYYDPVSGAVSQADTLMQI